MAESINESRIAYLYEAIRCGGVRAAADFLNLAPSAVSRQIALLEDELGVALLERHKRGVQPTEAGEMLIEYFRQQRSHKQDLLAKLQEWQGLRLGSISIVMGEGFVSSMVGGPVMEFSARYPGISVKLDICSTNDVLRKVAEDEAEIGLAFNPAHDARVVSRAQLHAPLQAIVGPRFPLFGSTEAVTLHQLSEYSIVLMHEAYGTRQLVDAAMLLDRVRLAPAITTNSLSVLKRLVASGQTYTLLSPIAVAAELELGELAAIPVENALLSNSEAHLITRVGRQLSPAANRLLQHLSAQMRQ